MEQLNFPAQGIPLQLLDRILKRPNRQVCNELPVDSLSIFRLALLIGMNHRHLQGRVMLLLPDRRQELNPFVFDLKDGNDAGDTVPVIVDRLTGEVRQAQIFVAVMGASSFTYVEATWTQTLADWIGAHTRALAAIGGVPRRRGPARADLANER